MNWDTVKGDWKQFSGKVKSSGASSPTMSLPRSMAIGNSSKARSKRSTATPRIRRRRKSMTGEPHGRMWPARLNPAPRGGVDRPRASL